MKASGLFISLTLALITVSCTRMYQIEKRARQQVYVSLENEIKDFSPGAKDISLENLKTVYSNDTICILQFVATYTPDDGVISNEELQYVYYVDMLRAHFSNEIVFEEVFRTVPNMSDKEIKDSFKRVRKTGENVYNTFSSYGLPVKKAYDEQ